MDVRFHCIFFVYFLADWNVFSIISEMSHWRISLISVPLLLLLNFISGFKLKLITISLRSGLIYLHGFQLLILLPLLIETTSFVCINRINVLCLKRSSDCLAIVTTGVLNQPNFLMLIKN